MYKNTLLWTTSVDELVESENGVNTAKQTVHYRNGKLKTYPYVERGAKITQEALEDFAKAYRQGRLYFSIN